jgi:hypothetical protein
MKPMSVCCPHGRGCNCVERDEPCILGLCRQATDEEHAALAVRRWEMLQDTAGRNRAERRFRARAYERARDRALAVLLMRALLGAHPHPPRRLPVGTGAFAEGSSQPPQSSGARTWP